jgi:hypothetical protein
LRLDLFRRHASVTKLYGAGGTPFASADARQRRKCKISAALVAIADRFFGLVALPIYTVALILDLVSAGLGTGVLDRRGRLAGIAVCRVYGARLGASAGDPPWADRRDHGARRRVENPTRDCAAGRMAGPTIAKALPSNMRFGSTR